MIRLSGLVRVAVAAIVVAGSPALADQPRESIRVGATVSLEGKYRDPSLMIRDGYRLWAQEINRNGGLLGRPVELILYDDRSMQERVGPLYEKLIVEDGIDIVLSPYGTPLTLEASAVSERYGMVMLACGASGEILWQRGFQYVFGVYALANRYFIGLLDLMARQGFGSVSIIYEDSPFNRDVVDGTVHWAARFGLQVALRKAFSNGEREMQAAVASAHLAASDGLILSAYPPDAYRMLRIMESRGFHPPVVGITIAPIHPDFAVQAGEMAEGVFAPSQWEPDERIPFPGTRKFIDDFTVFAQRPPSYHAGSAYAACQIMARGVMLHQSLDQDKLRDYIRSLDTVTVVGRFKVDYQGRQIGHNPITIQWQDGKKEIVYPPKMQTAQPRF